jgi:hypothetical protein
MFLSVSLSISLYLILFLTLSISASPSTATSDLECEDSQSGVNLLQLPDSVTLSSQLKTQQHVPGSTYWTPSTPTAIAGAQALLLRLDREDHVAERRRLGTYLMNNSRGQEEIIDGIRNYATRYQELLAQRSMIFFLHVSKTAGTMLCDLGKENGCRLEPDFCHVDIDEWFLWNGTFGTGHGLYKRERKIEKVVKRKRLSCAGLSQLYDRSNLTLEGNENYLIAAGPCPEFWNVMTFRDPIDRLLSHLSMLAEAGFLNEMPVTTNTTVREVFTQFPLLSNNYYIRSLLGEDVFLLPFGEITRTHLEEAKRVLQKFDVLLTMGEGNATSLEDEIKLTLGWDSAQKGTIHRKGTTATFRSTLNWTMDDWEVLRAANALDLELWQHAKSLTLIDRQVFSHPTFSEVSASWPRTVCGYLSK